MISRLLLLCLALAPFPALADSGLPSQPYIYVKGNAEIEKEPDVVSLHFDLVAREPDQAKANADVQSRAAKVFALLRDRKIANNDIIAEQITSEAEFQQDQSHPYNRGKLIGYTVTRQMHAKVRDVNAFPGLVNDLIRVANAEFTGIEPEYSKTKEQNGQLWEKAIADARQQADNAARQTGMKIQSVYAISPVAIPDIESTIFPKTESGRIIVTGSNVPTQEDRVSSEYRLAPIRLAQAVHIIYLLAPAK